MSDSELELPPWLELNPAPAVGTATVQLAQQIRGAIAAGALSAGERLPATRVLARSIGRSRGTVVAAIEQLCAEGLLSARPGAGTYVSADAVADYPRTGGMGTQWVAPRVRPAKAAVDAPLPGAIDFGPCRPSVDTFPLQTWRRCVAWAAGRRPSPDYGDPRGDESLRTAITDYLRRARGLRFDPDSIMITNGAVHAMHLVAQVYLARHAGQAQPVAVMEDPGFPLARQTLSSAGAAIQSCPVDQDGLITDVLPSKGSGVRLVYVTPSHQFPTGSRLSLGRRRTLVEWANAHDVLIIEDDYDGEFRYDVQPLAPLAAMGNGCVVYCGTFSKTLFPDLRIGFAAAHPRQIELLSQYRVRTDYTSNQLMQRALARFIQQGSYEKHIHRMRRLYAAKRKALADALSSLPVPLELRGLDSGLNALVQLPERDCGALSIETLAQRARSAGVLMPRLADYRHDSEGADGLVLGYAALSLADIERGVAVLR